MTAAQPITGFDQEFRVVVKNDNSEEAILKFNGKDYRFPTNKAVPLTLEEAHFLFAVDARDGTINRAKDRTSGYPNDDPYYKQCCLRYGCWNPPGIKWFDNFRFKIDKRKAEITAETFEKL